MCEMETLTPSYGKFVIEPFERGFGTTIGNSLRRVLLSSLEGAAVTSVKVEGVPHEFTSIPGVREDVSEILLNVKGIVVRMSTDEPRTIRIQKQGKGEVRAADIMTDPSVEVMNGAHHIATLSDGAKVNLEMSVRRGRGYVTAEANTLREREIGLVPVDSLFSPVVRVRYRTEDTRVGQRTNYDRLILEIWTNETLDPEMALVEAAKILRKHLNPFVQYFEIGRELHVTAEIHEGEKVEDNELASRYGMKIADLDLSVRARNCLMAENITTVGELVQKTEGELLKIRNFGKTSLSEIKRKLEVLGLGIRSSDKE
jgi:DNA-directed RNA polymerase subunit alpha